MVLLRAGVGVSTRVAMVKQRRPQPRPTAHDTGALPCGNVTQTTADLEFEYVCQLPAGHADGCAGEWCEVDPEQLRRERHPDWRERQAGER